MCLIQFPFLVLRYTRNVILHATCFATRELPVFYTFYDSFHFYIYKNLCCRFMKRMVQKSLHTHIVQTMYIWHITPRKFIHSNNAFNSLQNGRATYIASVSKAPHKCHQSLIRHSKLCLYEEPIFKFAILYLTIIYIYFFCQ